MSCNGCRILRKGCSDNCMLRQCLQLIECPQAQAHATVFVAKFFGRAGLMSFISSVPEFQRPALFQSLLFEAVGRTVNPVGGAVSLLWTGRWNVCQSAVETVLRGGALKPIQGFNAAVSLQQDCDDGSESGLGTENDTSKGCEKRKRFDNAAECEKIDVDLSLSHGFMEKRRAVTPSEESDNTTATSGSSSVVCSSAPRGEKRLLRLFS